MAEGGDPEWELSKENIQPLRRGRAISTLHQALCQQQDGAVSAVHQQRQYIKWAEQTFPQGGKESHLTTLLERAVTLFTEEKKYHNDTRYVDLWIKFAEICPEPLEIYRYMQAQRIGVAQASFYIAWSEEYERQGNSRGLQSQGAPAPSGAKNSQFVVFDESKAPAAETSESKWESWAAPPPARAKENEQKAEKWCDVKMPQRSRYGHKIVAPPVTKPSFQPFVEVSDEPPTMTPCKINSAVNTVLSVRKPCPEETPLKRLQDHQQQQQQEMEGGQTEGGKAQEKRMYCQELLFSGATEFCFEELHHVGPI
ncbi:hypothetical protein CRUP_019749 [Coryphaenoides rupestris]|nr:hypothetical protein CRUP_019749 [Coryphaenoides rupestris]